MQRREKILTGAALALLVLFAADRYLSSGGGDDVAMPVRGSLPTEPAPPVSEVAAPAVDSGAASPNPLAGRPIADFDAMVERPLFSPTRRPPPEDSTASNGSPAAVDSDYVLEGVIMSDDDRVVVLRRVVDNERIRLRIDQAVDNWVLRDISARSVVLERGDTRRELVLTKDPGPSATGDARPIEGLRGTATDSAAPPTPPPPSWLAISPPKS
jgi:hypothetical protein